MMVGSAAEVPKSTANFPKDFSEWSIDLYCLWC